MRSLPRRTLAGLAAVVVLAARPAGEASAQAPSGGDAAADAGRDSTVQAAAQRLTAWAAKHGGVAGVSVVDVGTGRVLAASGERKALNPASNAKVLTAATALKRLGPSYRFTTGIYGRIRDGVLERPVLRGHGDPSLGLADLYRLARAVSKLGVTRVDGGLRVDQSWFDSVHVPPAFDQQPNEWAAFRAPVSAVALERNAVTLNVVARSAGKPARIWFDPPGFVSVSGKVPTVGPGGGQSVRLALRPKGRKLDAVLGGRVAEGLPRLRFARRVDDPTLLAGYVLVHLFDALGVEVDGDVTSGGSGEKRRVAFVGSEPLSALLGELGKSSDNFYAEMILKAIGAESGSRPARAEDGARAVVAWMKEVGADGDGLSIKNGSGLFDANRVSAHSLARALVAAHRDPAISAELVSQLAIGGVDGTLRSRFRKHRTARSIRAKTGTLAKAITLSGYVLDAKRGPVAFSILVNGIAGKHGAVRREVDRVVEAIVRRSS